MSMLTIVATCALVVLLFAGVASVPFGLPGIYVIAGGYLAYGLIQKDISWPCFIVVVVIACVAEALDWVVGILGARKFGTSKAGMVGAVVGMIIGAIVGTPIPIIGNVIGLFTGLFAGAYIFEYASSKDREKAKQSAIGALLGKATAIAIKFILAIICIVYICFVIV